MRLLLCVVAVVLLVASLCSADVTNKFNGLTKSEVIEAIGEPLSRYQCVALGYSDWYYTEMRIRFRNGVISECEVYKLPAESVPSETVSEPITTGAPVYKDYDYKDYESTSVPVYKGYQSTTNVETPTYSVGTPTYLVKLSPNKYDPESISNSYGAYGSRYGNNLMNPYSTYGSRYSSQSWTNPYTTTAPKIYSSR